MLRPKPIADDGVFREDLSTQEERRGLEPVVPVRWLQLVSSLLIGDASFKGSRLALCPYGITPKAAFVGDRAQNPGPDGGESGFHEKKNLQYKEVGERH